jgi:hypothetical protein
LEVSENRHAFMVDVLAKDSKLGGHLKMTCPLQKDSGRRINGCYLPEGDASTLST